APTMIRRRRERRLPPPRHPRSTVWRAHRSRGLHRSASTRASIASTDARRAGLQAVRWFWRQRVARREAAWPRRKKSLPRPPEQRPPSPPIGPSRHPRGQSFLTGITDNPRKRLLRHRAKRKYAHGTDTLSPTPP